MLSDADETLLHQVALPFAQAGTTDHRFYDRYIFGGWDEGQGIGFLAGLGVYKNLATTDGFLVIQHGGQQHNLRASEPWDCARTVGQVGPLQLRIVEPYRRALIQSAPNSSGLECELVWSSDSGVHFEPPHRAHGAEGSWDYCRYNQCGSVEGTLKIGDANFEARDWWGFRDHSWGIRPGVGGFEPIRQSARGPAARALLLSLFYRTSDYSCHMIRIENASGDALYQHGTLIAPDRPLGDLAELLDWRHEIDYVGENNYRSFRYRTLWSDGRAIEITGKPVLEAWIFRGAGYDHGFNDGRGLGAQRGNVIEHDVSSRNIRAGTSALMHFEQPAALIVDGVAVQGYAPMIVYPNPK